MKPALLEDGVGASRVVLPRGPWPTALAFLQSRFADIPAAEWRERMARGRVRAADGAALAPEAPYRAGATLYYFREVASEPPVPFTEEVLHQDEHLLVADKPHFLQVVPSGRHVQETLLVRLQKRFPGLSLTALHRLDRGTAGLVLLSTNPDSRGHYQALFRNRQIHKSYEALAPPLPALAFPLTRRSRIVERDSFPRMREVEGPVNAETLIGVPEARGAHWLYRLHPVTGKKHQLRVHMAALGAPLLNDPLYPEHQPQAPEDYSRPLKLLARELSFKDPLSGQQRCFRSRREL